MNIYLISTNCKVFLFIYFLGEFGVWSSNLSFSSDSFFFWKFCM